MFEQIFFIQMIYIREEKNIPEKVCPEIGCTPGIMLFQTEYFHCFQKYGLVYQLTKCS